MIWKEIQKTVPKETLKVLSYGVAIFLVAHLFLDFIDKISAYLELQTFKFNKYLKLIFMVFALLIALKYSLKTKRDRIYFVYVPLFFFLFFFIKNYIIGQVPAVTRNFFLFAVLPLFHMLTQNNNQLKELCLKVLRYFIIVNFLMIMLGVVGDIQLFRSYYNRFGFNGLILNQVQASYFYVSMLFVFYKKKDFVLLAIIIVSGLMLGTKAFLLGFFLFMISLFLYVEKLNSRLRITAVFLSTVFAISAIAITLSSPLFRKVIQENNIITAVLSYRDQLLLGFYHKINPDNFNLLIGVLKIKYYRSELGFVDVFLFLGLIGLVFYCFMMLKIWQYFTPSKLSKSYFIAIMTMVFLGGNFFSFPFNSFMFILSLALLFENPMKGVLIDSEKRYVT